MGFFSKEKPLVYDRLLVLGPIDPVPSGFRADIDVDTTSHSNTVGQQLSPFLLGPTALPDGTPASTIENLWQFTKCFDEHWDEARQQPDPQWWDWRDGGLVTRAPTRYPMGKGAKPVCHWWEGRALGTVEARLTIYREHYLPLAVQTGAWRWLKRELRRGKHIVLRDFGAFDHVVAGLTFGQCLRDPHRNLCHAFLLAEALEAWLSDVQQEKTADA